MYFVFDNLISSPIHLASVFNLSALGRRKVTPDDANIFGETLQLDTLC